MPRCDSSNLGEGGRRIPFKSFIRSFILLLDSQRTLYVFPFARPLGIGSNIRSSESVWHKYSKLWASASLTADESGGGGELWQRFKINVLSTALRTSASSLWLSAAELWIRVCQELIGINTANIVPTVTKVPISASWKIKVETDCAGYSPSVEMFPEENFQRHLSLINLANRTYRISSARWGHAEGNFAYSRVDRRRETSVFTLGLKCRVLEV